MIPTPESLEVINQRLIDYYGFFQSGQPNYKLVWADNEREKRWCSHTKEGLNLLEPELREEQKYNYIRERYVLEKLFPIAMSGIITPGINELTTKTSYEPVWTFEDKHGNYLPPIWPAIEIIIDSIHRAMNNAGHNVPVKAPSNGPEETQERIRIIEEELYGNETSISDALMTDRAVGYGTRSRNDDKFRNN